MALTWSTQQHKAFSGSSSALVSLHQFVSMIKLFALTAFFITGLVSTARCRTVPLLSTNKTLVQERVNRTLAMYLHDIKEKQNWLEVILKNVHKETLIRNKHGCKDDFCTYRLDYVSEAEKPTLVRYRRKADDVLLPSAVSSSQPLQRTESAFTDNGETLPGVSDQAQDIMIMSTSVKLTEFKESSSSASSTSTPQHELSTSGDEKSSPTMVDSHLLSSSTVGFGNEPSTASSQKPSLPPMPNSSRYSDLKFLSENKNEQIRNCLLHELTNCPNSIKCTYVEYLMKFVCGCKPGFMGSKCDIFDLRITIDTLTPYRKTQIIIDTMSNEQASDVESVIEATARFTLNAIEEE